jgi:plasmid stabilization system protein ParE
MKPIILHPEAAEELENAATFYESHRTGFGELFRLEVHDAFAQIASVPTIFPLYKGGPVRRRLLKKKRFPYGVYFVERDKDILVLTIFDQRRWPDSWMHRLKGI